MAALRKSAVIVRAAGGVVWRVKKGKIEKASHKEKKSESGSNG